MDKEAALETGRKIVFNRLPILGDVFNELFDYGSRVKQNRLNTFTEYLESYFQNKGSVDFRNLTTEEVYDFFDSVFRKVVRTTSDAKLRIYRDILIQKIEHPEQTANFDEIFLDLVEQLSEIEIRILFNHLRYEREIGNEVQKHVDLLNITYEKDRQRTAEYKLKQDGLPNRFEELEIEHTEAKQAADEQQEKVNTVAFLIQMEYFNLSEAEYLYFKQTMASRGLVVDTDNERRGKGMYSHPFWRVRLTHLGKRFIEFIMTSQTDGQIESNSTS